MRVDLVVALPEEARTVARVMRAVQRDRSGQFHGRTPSVSRLSGRIGGQAVGVAWAGAGERCAERAAEALLQAGAESLLAVGFAGSLSPALRPGDLLLATEVLATDGTRWPADTILLEAMGSETPEAETGGTHARASSFTTSPRQGALFTAASIVATAVEKRRLGEETGALAVDMESAAVARCAAAAKVPMIALRAITDGVDERLPLDFNLCLDSHGQFHYGRLILLLARHPLAMGGLVRLGRHSALAGQALASFLAWSLPRVSGCPSAATARQ